MFRLFSVVALVLAAATSAQAQNNKPIRSGTYYEDRASSSVNYNQLYLTFAQTPTDKFLNVTKVMCEAVVRASQSLVLAKFWIGTSSGGVETGRSVPLELSPNSFTDANYRYFTFSPQIYVKVGPGRYPLIILYSNATSNLYFYGDCTIVGDLTDD